MYKVYGDSGSGNCYKIQMLMGFLGLDYDWQHIDVLAGDTQTPEFLAMNSNAKIPVLQLSQWEYLYESNAILNFLAEGSSFLPESGLARARVLQWQFFEQYSHEPFIAVARYINKYLGLPEHKTDEYLSKQEGGHKALAVMEAQLSETPYLVGVSATIADISLYAYTHVSYEGGFELARYPKIQNWLTKMEKLPGYVSMAK